jgi:protein SCO1/2
MTPPVRRALIVGLAAFVVAAAIAALWPRLAGEERGGDGTASGRADIGGPFALTDSAGKRRTDAEFRGKPMLVFFGFTHCPDFCPTALYAVSQAMDRLGRDADRLTVVFITVDPERDTPAALAAYAPNFDKRIVWLTGSEAEIAAVARAYRVYYSKKPLAKPGEYTVDHSTYLYLMGRDGAFVTHFRHGIAPADLAAALKKNL